MKFQAVILLHLLLISHSFITYDSNQVVNQYGSYFTCQNNASYTNTTIFSGQFENVPQVFLSLENVDESTPKTIINFSITSITTTNFQTKIKCTNNQLYKFYYKWWAIDDNRIQVINFFDSTAFGQQSAPHQNANAIKGLPSIFSYSYTSAFSVDITIDEITTTTVKYTITSTGGLTNLGYSIVLITEESYNFIERASMTADYTGTTIDIVTNFWLVAPYVGFNYPNTEWIREYKSYVTTSTQITYKFLHNGTKCPNTFLAAWLAYIFSKQFMPMEIKRVNSALYYEFQQNQPFNTIKIQELNQYYSQFGTNSLIVEKNVNILNIEIINTCDIGKTYVANFHSCNSCSQTTRYLKNACVSMQNRLAYRIRLQSATSDYKELFFILSNTGVQIKQITYNQKKTETILVDIQENNQ